MHGGGGGGGAQLTAFPLRSLSFSVCLRLYLSPSSPWARISLALPASPHLSDCTAQGPETHPDLRHPHSLC